MKAINSMKMTAVAVVASLALVTFSQAQAQERREQKATRVYEQPKNERKLNEPRKADSYANYDNQHDALRKAKTTESTKDMPTGTRNTSTAPNTKWWFTTGRIIIKLCTAKCRNALSPFDWITAIFISTVGSFTRIRFTGFM